MAEQVIEHRDAQFSVFGRAVGVVQMTTACLTSLACDMPGIFRKFIAAG
ncbi:hypothetical protein [Pseudomonas sp. EL_65y_Pfl2_R95]